jgi:tRNA-uridine 2-sulfurtransferase
VRPEEIAARVRVAFGEGESAPFARPAHLAAGTRVVAAMSGGVDSAVAAALVCAAGFQVVGVSMRLGRAAARSEGHRGCCSLDDFDDARRAAAKLGIPHYVVDLRDTFQSAVIDAFSETYLAGRTPNPCTLCNRDVKFGALWDFARALGASAIATGHYARISHDERGFALRAGADRRKDQSYFLFTLGQGELARTLFPVGDLHKPAVRAVAAALELPLASKPESQDICFVAGTSYDEFVEREMGPERRRPGRIVDQSGAVLGEHDGIHRFTVGQRRGLGGGASAPRYVTAIDPASGDVRVGGRADLACRGFTVSGLRWTGAVRDGAARVRLRHRHEPLPCVVESRGDTAEVRLEAPAVGVTPGQAAVWYDGDVVLGGGWIEAPL